MAGLRLSTQAHRAKTAMERRSAQLDAYDFNPTMVAEVHCEDGSIFRVADSFLEEWVDPHGGPKWVFMFCEHYPPMFWDQDDLIFWATWTARKGPTNKAYS